MEIEGLIRLDIIDSKNLIQTRAASYLFVKML